MALVSNVPSVVFLDILDQYSFNADLTCKFRISLNYESQRKDCVAIFKLGWSQVTEYISIKCVPEALKDQICSLTFDRNVFPKDTLNLYQICYISGNDLHGASSPFQFCTEDNCIVMTTSDSFASKVLSSIGSSMANYQDIVEKDQEISRLKEENGMLREFLKVMLANKAESSKASPQAQLETAKSYDEEIKEVKDLVEGVKSMVLVHDADIDMLKNKIREGGEVYKKLYLEKYKLQKKYEKLKNTFSEKGPLHEENLHTNNFNLDIGDLQSIPPFPSLTKQ